MAALYPKRPASYTTPGDTIAASASWIGAKIVAKQENAQKGSGNPAEAHFQLVSKRPHRTAHGMYQPRADAEARGTAPPA
ncbi:MAG: hypothetical protein JWN27_426 [Candidatus Eremiobacteraeota bacterium]|nr:hypothetical protein [Candidatus Eremiobacteraeota bacterium]